MKISEPTFPRGGNERDDVKAKVKSTSLFEQKIKKNSKTKKSKPLVVHTSLSATPAVTAAQEVSYKDLSEGMKILGCIHDISDYFVSISLPGFMQGKALLTHISDPYSEALQKVHSDESSVEEVCTLPEMFYIGQLVTAHVHQISKPSEHKTNVTLSLNPSHINAEWSHRAMASKDLIITAAVRSKEEHGYIMDCGVKALRCFLKEESARAYCNTFFGGRELAIGQLVQCVVTKAESTSAASNIEVSADPELVAKYEEKGYPSLDFQQLLPGMRFSLTVSQCIKYGVKVQFHNFTAYLHQNHLPPQKSGKSKAVSLPTPGTKMFGRILYIIPTIKTIYLSALPSITDVKTELPKPQQSLCFKVGDKVPNAVVSEVSGRGVTLTFGSKGDSARGFVPLRRCDFNYQSTKEDSDSESTMLQRLLKKFPLNSHVLCRLLHFDHMTNTFVCSMEKSVVNEKYFTQADVTIGEVVQCEVESITHGGIVVRVGRITGFVPASDSADVPLHNPGRKFHPGAKLKARVLKLDAEKHKLILTLKQSLVSSEDPILASYESAQIGMSYLGTVVSCQGNKVVVAFFGGVRGLLFCNPHTVPVGQTFREGQLLKCFVTECTSDKILLSLLEPEATLLNQASRKRASKNEAAQEKAKRNKTTLEESIKDEAHSDGTDSDDSLMNDTLALVDAAQVSESETVKVGHKYNLEVILTEEKGLTVQVEVKRGKKVQGVVPVLHLSDDIRLAKLLLRTYEVGMKLNDVWCYSNTKKYGITFSMRETVNSFFQGQIIKKKTVESVFPGLILPCTFRTMGDNFIVLDLPLSSKSNRVIVPKANVCSEPDEAIEDLKLVKGQSMQAKVLDVDTSSNKLNLSCQTKIIWSGELETSVKHLENYLIGQRRLLEFAIKMDDPLGAYKTGSDVTGEVSERTKWGFTLKLDNGVRGEMTFFNAAADSIELGTKISGKVLFVDCIRRHVEISMNLRFCSKLTDEVEATPDMLGKRLKGAILLVTPEFLIVQLKCGGKRKQAFMPTNQYPFGVSPLALPQPYFGIDQKVIVKSVREGVVICLPKELVEKLRKKEKQEHKDELKQLLRAQRDSESGLISPDDIKIEKTDDDEEEEISDDAESSEPEIETSPKSRKRNGSHAFNQEKESEEVVKKKKSKRNKDKHREQNNVDKNSEALEAPEISSNGSHAFNEEKESEEVVKKKKSKRNKDKHREQSNVVKNAEALETHELSSKKSKLQDIKDQNTHEPSSMARDIEACDKKSDKRKKKKQIEDNETVNVPNMNSKKKHKEIGDSNVQDDVDELPAKNNTSGLQLKAPGFVWDVDPSKFMQILESNKEEMTSEDDSDEDDSASKKKKQKKSASERREAAKLEEERLRKIEEQHLDPNWQPISCDDFDKMLLANPNSSDVWLQYMAFHLQATEIDKARAVAQRAIKTISYREEQEKLNVWVGLLNMENLYGTTESLKTTLEQALQFNDPYKVRVQMVRMYAESGKSQELESEVRFVVKKFKETSGMWLELATILMKYDHAQRARELLQQALPHLRNKQESVYLVTQFALLEARHDNLEKAKALMDPVLASYPKRIDIWFTYVDMLVKANLIDEARQLLERAVSQKLPPGKMKSIFTKFLQFEEAHGTSKGQERVRQLAVDYVKQVAGDKQVQGTE